MDSTINLPVKKEIKKYLNAIQAINTLKAHHGLIFEGETVDLYSNNKTEELRYKNTFYNKEKELLKKENNWMQEFINPSDFHNVLRNEARFNHFRLQRKMLGIEKKKIQPNLGEDAQLELRDSFRDLGDKYSKTKPNRKAQPITLLEALESKEKPNLRLFQDIRGQLPTLLTDDKVITRKEAYTERICREGDFNFAIIDLYLKETFKESTYYRRKKEVKQFLDERGKSPVERKKINLLLDEIEERMEEAYQ
jgi:hypothetical protein